MAASRECEIPELFPQPKVIQFLEGFSELALDVRLDTSNVLPIQRKAVRTILGGIGVRVIANKKKFVVRARVEDPALFDLQDVPEDCRKDYYELAVQNSEVVLRTPAQDGMVWAAQTLASLFKLVQQGRKLPNLKIRDWSETPVRGLYVDCAWGADRMGLNDWFQVIDIASAMKLNLIGIGIYSCESQDRLDADSRPYECLMVPLGNQDDEHVFVDELETVTPHHLRWFNVQADMWRDEEYLPVMQQQNFLKDVVAYGHERGVRVMPSFQFSGGSMLFPRVHPEFAAVDAEGRPVGEGCCYQSPALRKFCETVLGRFLNRYFAGGLEYFHLRFDDGQEHVSEENRENSSSFRCSCPGCTAKKDSPLWQDFALWLIRFLREQGVSKVVLSGNELLCGNTASSLLAALRQAGLLENVIFCPDGRKDYSRFGGAQEVESWLSPLVEPEKKLSYQNCRMELKKVLLSAEKLGVPGVLLRTNGDAACMDQVALLGCAAWEGKGRAEEDEKIQRHWAQLQFAAGMNSYLDAAANFAGLIENPLLLHCVPYSYFRTGCQTVMPQLGEFPGEALRNIMELEPSAELLREKLSELSGIAGRITQELDKILENDSLGFALQDCLDSFRQDAALFAVWLEVFSLLAVVHRAERDHELKRGLADKCRELRQRLLAVMKVYEEKKASWMMPRAMQPASEMVVFLEQLAADIVTASNGKDLALRWKLEKNWFEVLEK